MNIVVCGAGEVGSQAVDLLANKGGHNVTVVDHDPERLLPIEETMDVRTLAGNCADTTVLRAAGAESAAVMIAATNQDEINLLAASMAKRLGSRRVIARVHDVAFVQDRGEEYQSHLNIDRLICPEYATAQAIARGIRNPGAVAIEHFARGQIEMQEFVASEGGSAIGKRLMDVRFPTGTRLALISRKGDAIVPKASSVVAPGDTVILVGNADTFDAARKLFKADKVSRRKVVLMGGPPIARWLCESLRDRAFSIRLFERDRARAAELSESLSWATVLASDPTDRAVFEEENLGQADLFISLLSSDEANIIAGAMAKVRGVAEVMTICQQSKYVDTILEIGVDKVFSPRSYAGDEIESFLDETPTRYMGSLAQGVVDVFRVRIGERSAAVGKPLQDLGLAPDWVVAALQRGRDVHVPTAQDIIDRGDVALVVGRHGTEETLGRLLIGTAP